MVQPSLHHEDIHRPRIEMQSGAISDNAACFLGSLLKKRWRQVNACQIAKPHLLERAQTVSAPTKQVDHRQIPIQVFESHLSEPLQKLRSFLFGRLEFFVCVFPTRVATVHTSVPVSEYVCAGHFRRNSSTLPKKTTKNSWTPKTQRVVPGTTNLMVWA